ncbi:hypothetical protein ACTDI4_05535 [Mesorhizobium sp. PUT5]|uniref:hypothetical protein n=1 Tax=Mesorhizobium sp. PUT5 TaxID=3454629 RepID=UPI003FA4BEE8
MQGGSSGGPVNFLEGSDDWLAAAKTALPLNDKIDRNDRNAPERIKSISSILSEGGNPSFRQAEIHPGPPTPRNEAPAAILECDAGLSREEAERQAAGSALSPVGDISKRTAIAAKGDLRRDVKFAPVVQPDDPETYVEALRVHGPMTYGMAMRVLGWGGTRAGQAETALRAAGRITLNNHGRAVLTGAQS